MSLKQAKEQPARVPSRAKQAGEIRAGWTWVESIVWTERMLTALEQGVKGEIPLLPWVILHGDSLRCSWSTLFEENHRLESRMRENRTSGSEGGGAGNLTGPSYPINNFPTPDSELWTPGSALNHEPQTTGSGPWAMDYE